MHKVQGLTLPKIIIGLPHPDEKNNMLKRETPHLLYVAISRVRSLDSVAFTREFYPSLVRPSNQTLAWRIEQQRLNNLEKENDRMNENLE